MVNLAGVHGANEDSGVTHGAALVAFAEAVIGTNLEALTRAREALADAIGPDGLVSAAITAAAFSLVDRAANGIGIFVEPMVLEPSTDFREQFGINDFPSAVNTLARG